MDLRQLTYFLAIAETGSVSAASRQVHIAQPALTRQLRLLEEDLATRLFERRSSGMELTVTGQALAEDAVELLARCHKIKARINALGEGRIGKLSLGVTVAQLWVPLVTKLLGEYRQHYQDVALEVFPLLSGPQIEQLRDGRLDAGILYLDDKAQNEFATRLLFNDHLILAVPEASCWASQPPHRLEDVRDADFIWAMRRASPSYHDRITAHFRRHGFSPRIVQYGADNLAILSMISAGIGISIVPASSSWHPVPGICFVELTELTNSTMPLCLVWRVDNTAPALNNLMILCNEVLS